MGLKIHTKPKKLIPPTQTIDWIGWQVCTRTLRVTLTEGKRLRGLQMCFDLHAKHFAKEPITARMIMSVAGFLNFVSSVLRQSRPFLRSLYLCLAIAQVFSAWQAGKRKFDPIVNLANEAIQDLSWWCIALQQPLHRPLHVLGNRVFMWHKNNPDLSDLHKLAWSEGLVVVIH